MSLTLETTPIIAPSPLKAAALVATRGTTPDPVLREACVARGAGAENLERLFGEGALCVTSGQQPGLLTGPLFTIYKALTAVALARALEAQLGRSVVPVFWVAGDDHDFLEANHVYHLTSSAEVERVELRARAADAPLRPLSQEPLGPEIGGVIDTVLGATPDSEFRGDVEQWVRRHYRPEQDFAGAFAEALAELLAPYGLVVFRSTHLAAKRAMGPHLLAALESSKELDRRLAERAAELRGADRPTPVPVGDGATLVMIEDEQGRDRLVRDDGGYVARRTGKAWRLDDLRALANHDPQRLSPNVLLRPAMEAALLPTLAYVAGPGELAYLPQTDPIFRMLEIAPQAAVPRWSGRVIETRVAKVLDKYGIAATDLALPEGQLEASLVEGDMPPAAREALAALRRSLQEHYAGLEAAAVDVDVQMQKPVQSARNAALAGVAQLEKRLISHLKKRNDIVLQQIAKARNSLFPQGQPQERVFNVIPYLVRYGPQFLDAALDACAATLPALDGTPPEG
ncbi:MAG: bacillithiol biosynthesis cysteine-adding enzyme BshC [Gemmatimonadota bacterium]|nr:MAG: bacillithiol biosynthesis cysteine-adding enzyme BshC [Gemmatimonadota bacterium]